MKDRYECTSVDRNPITWTSMERALVVFADYFQIRVIKDEGVYGSPCTTTTCLKHAKMEHEVLLLVTIRINRSTYVRRIV